MENKTGKYFKYAIGENYFCLVIANFDCFEYK